MIQTASLDDRFVGRSNNIFLLFLWSKLPVIPSLVMANEVAASSCLLANRRVGEGEGYRVS